MIDEYSYRIYEDDLEEKGLKKGLEKGREEGREQGREEGLEKGALMGKIQVIQEIIGVSKVSDEELKAETIESLKKMLADLKSQLSAG